MILAPEFEFPPEQEAQFQKAKRLEYVTIAYMVSASALLYLVMGSSQAMRTGFFEDVINVVPSLAFLVCARVARMAPRPDYPYGFHTSVSIGYLTASLALLAMGAFLAAEAVLKLASVERTTIGGVHVLGHTVWAGWPMMLGLAYTVIPSVFIGRMKMRLAPRVHDKILYAEAQMMKADWMAGTATAIGVLGVGFGYWWLDPLAAALVSLDILKDGVTNVGVAVADLIERRPMKTDRSGYETLPEELRGWMARLDWVKDVEVRLRENGHVFFGEVFVVPRTAEGLPEKVSRAVHQAKQLDWRLHDITVTPVDRLPARG